MLSLRVNEKGLIYLDAEKMNAIFDCVYGISDGLNKNTKKLLKEEEFKDFIKLLLTMQNYNYCYRFEETAKLFPLFEFTVGPMEVNSEGTTLWLALGLAIKELYGLRRSTLQGLLKEVKVRK